MGRFVALGLAAEMVERLEGTGLAGVYIVRPENPEDQVHLRLVVLSGEADNAGTEGIAHYVEHLAWLSARDAVRHGLDHHTNASVTMRSTSYWMSGKRGDWRELAEALVRVLEPFTLDDEFMLQERDIIQQEHRYRVSGNPYARLRDALRRRAHGNNPFSRSLLGRPEGIASFSLGEAKAFHRATHRPDNSVLIVRGEVPSEELLGSLRRRFGLAAKHGDIRPPDYVMPPPIRDVRVRNVDGSTRPALLYRKILELPEKDGQRGSGLPELTQQLALLHDVLTSSLPGSLARPLRYDHFIAESFRLGIDALSPRHIQLEFFAHPDRSVSLETLLEQFETALVEISGRGIPVETFRRLRQRYIDRLDRQDDLETFAFREILRVVDSRTDVPPRELSAYREYAREITREQLDTLMRLLAGPGRVVATMALSVDG